MYKQKSLDDDTASEFLNPNKFSENGTLSMGKYSFSENGEICAYTISEFGSDWVTMKFRVVKDGTDLEDVLENMKNTGIVWSKDGRGVFYEVSHLKEIHSKKIK